MKLFICAAIVLALAGCVNESSEVDNYRAVKRQEIFKDCLARIPKGPETTRYNDWDEVIQRCDTIGYWQSKDLNPAFERKSSKVGDMCQQRDDLLEPAISNKFHAYVCIRPRD